MKKIWYHLDRIESYVCRCLLLCFVSLLFAQVVSRQVFGQSITWIEELSVILFVWFAYFGASYAARMAAHNRVSFHLNHLPRRTAYWIEALADLFWVIFNLIFIWYAFEFIDRLKPFVKAQTLGWQMRWLYMALPAAFILMTLRILQVNFMKLVQDRVPRDPDRVDLNEIAKSTESAR